MAEDGPFEALRATEEQTAEQITKQTQGAMENYFGWLQKSSDGCGEDALHHVCLIGLTTTSVADGPSTRPSLQGRRDRADDVDPGRRRSNLRIAKSRGPAANVRFWHKADIARLSSNVRFCG
jgi:hypothetical protein